EVFEYRRIRIKERDWPQAAEKVRGAVPSALTPAEGGLYCLWQPQIGVSIFEGVVVTTWPDVMTALENGYRLLSGIDDVVRSSAEILVPVARAKAAAPLTVSGFYSNRWFEVSLDNLDRFVELSLSTWPQWEKENDTEVVGLWRSLSVHDRGTCRVLLAVRYPTLGHWQNSR
ncbi:unnamed protein product, partial [Ectocarpus fasciculatus]